jgi:hypothetical protein
MIFMRYDRIGRTLGVGLDSGWSNRLGQDTDTSLDQPRDEDGSSVDTVLLGDLDDSGVLSELLSVGTSKGRVCLGENVVLLEVSD